MSQRLNIGAFERLSVIVVVLLSVVVCMPRAQAQVMTDGGGFLSAFEDPTPWVLLNTEADEYGPSVDAGRDRLFYTSEQDGTAAQWMLMNGADRPQKCTGTFNKEGHHRAYVSFGQGDEAVGVAFVKSERQSYPTIITVPIDQGALNEGHPIPVLVGDHFCSQPALSPDGTRLVFVSDRPGGQGGLDLWVCDRRTDTEWTTPALLSTDVNSDGDEITPVFIAADSLVYASNGYGGVGGFDLFLTVLRDGAWGEPELLPVFNSEFNESDLAVLPDGSVVFASDRPGGSGGLDLWISRRRR